MRGWPGGQRGVLQLDQNRVAHLLCSAMDANGSSESSYVDSVDAGSGRWVVVVVVLWCVCLASQSSLVGNGALAR